LWDDGNGNHGYNILESNYDISDGSGHGTHCAGTVCGDGTSGTITGMAPDATLMVVKVLDSDGAGTPESVIAGVQYAVENGAHVMSLSIGFTYAHTYIREAFREVFANALKAGVVAAVAAGNDGDELDRTLKDLSSLGDSLLSVAIVPVGVTQFREQKLKIVNEEVAKKTLQIASKYKNS
jgi:subtilisin family serine protease